MEIVENSGQIEIFQTFGLGAGKFEERIIPNTDTSTRPPQQILEVERRSLQDGATFEHRVEISDSQSDTIRWAAEKIVHNATGKQHHRATKDIKKTLGKALDEVRIEDASTARERYLDRKGAVRR